MSAKHKSLLADIGLLYAAAIWGATFIVVKDSLNYVHPLLLLGYRFSLAAALLGVYLAVKRRPLLAHWRAGLVLGLVLWLVYGPQTIGLAYTSAVNSALITGLFVAFVPPFMLLLSRQRPSQARLLAVAVSLLGLWFLTGGLSAVNLGDLITLAAAMGYALHILLADRFIKGGMDLFVLNAQQVAVVGLLSLLLGWLFKVPFTVANINTWGVIAFLALFPTISAFVIQFAAQKRTTPVKVALIFALEPVFGALFAWTLGGEAFIPLRAFGGLLIFAAIVMAELGDRVRAPALRS